MWPNQLQKSFKTILIKKVRAGTGWQAPTQTQTQGNLWLFASFLWGISTHFVIPWKGNQKEGFLSIPSKVAPRGRSTHCSKQWLRFKPATVLRPSLRTGKSESVSQVMVQARLFRAPGRARNGPGSGCLAQLEPTQFPSVLRTRTLNKM